MEKIELALLKAEIDAQVIEIDHIFTRIEERKKKKGKVAVESIGYQLHNLYCAFEDLFKIVAEAFENHIQDKSRYHVELLRRMTIPIEGVRPPLLGQESSSLLENLRSFRHFFRHAYSYELDERKVKIVLEDAFKLKEIYQRDINSFLNNL
ncbi:MAG: hypothetical protein KJ808_10070 [Acidobacteria bacterium]|nr:hypothetical protein [Acidobacteriota bacterium]MBU4307763.1 hypothetical protein [Acidobacteriota bacterium]MCG2810373.1 hypothetical protein [Candidatus Aminicenantes bacterium]